MDDGFFAGIAAAAGLLGSGATWLLAKAAPRLLRITPPEGDMTAAMKALDDRMDSLIESGRRTRAEVRVLRGELQASGRLTADALHECQRMADKLGGVGEKLAALVAVSGRD